MALVQLARTTFLPKVLQLVSNHSEMVEWLERIDSSMEVTTELWGFYKAVYLLKDLEKWILNKNMEAEKKGKGKGKGKAAESSTPVKRIHKKLRK